MCIFRSVADQNNLASSLVRLVDRFHSTELLQTQITRLLPARVSRRLLQPATDFLSVATARVLGHPAHQIIVSQIEASARSQSAHAESQWWNVYTRVVGTIADLLERTLALFGQIGVGTAVVLPIRQENQSGLTVNSPSFGEADRDWACAYHPIEYPAVLSDGPDLLLATSMFLTKVAPSNLVTIIPC